MNVKKHCFCCGNKLAESDSATVFVAEGNFGSGIFDPIGGSNQRLEILVCDDCGREKQKQGVILLVESVVKTKTTHKVKIWDGNEL